MTNPKTFRGHLPAKPVPPPAPRRHQAARFTLAFLRSPLSVGAILPSSRLLTKLMMDGCDFSTARTVVEIGPGSGAFTGEILKRLRPDATFFALELSEINVNVLRKRFPGLAVYHDSAEHIQKYLKRHGRRQADCLVSGLPWGNFSIRRQDRIREPVFRAVSPEGLFTTFAYLHAWWFPTLVHFRKHMRSRFEHIEATPVIWRNVPPAFVYRCSRGQKKAANKGYPLAERAHRIAPLETA